MFKKLFFILSLILSGYFASAQFNNNYGYGNSQTEWFQNGAVGSMTGFHFRTNYADTAAANTALYISGVPNFVIVVNGILFKRNAAATKWEVVSEWTTSGSDIYRLSKVAINKTSAGTDSTFEVLGTMNVSGIGRINGVTIKKAPTNGLSIGDAVGPASTSTSIQNHLIGQFAGRDLTTGNQNTAIGYAAMLNDSTTLGTVSIGHNSFRGHPSGNYNVAIGYEAMYNTGTTGTGSSNVGIGRNAVKSATSGSFNVGIGQSTLSSITTGQNNTAIGYLAGNTNTTGNDNIYIGANIVGPSGIVGQQINIGNAIRADSLRVVIGGTYSEPSAILDIKGTTRGLLIPRLTTAEMDAISTPATGLKLYNTTAGTEYAYNGTAYKSVGTISGSYDCAGCAIFPGTTTFTVTFGGTQPNATYKTLITPTNVNIAVPFYVTNKSTTSFDVNFIVTSGGSGATFDWAIFQ